MLTPKYSVSGYSNGQAYSLLLMDDPQPVRVGNRIIYRADAIDASGKSYQVDYPDVWCNAYAARIEPVGEVL